MKHGAMARATARLVAMGSLDDRMRQLRTQLDEQDGHWTTYGDGDEVPPYDDLAPKNWHGLPSISPGRWFILIWVPVGAVLLSRSASPAITDGRGNVPVTATNR